MLAKIFRDVVKSHYDSFRGDELVGRLIGVRLSEDGKSLNGCLRISFKDKMLIEDVFGYFKKHKIPYNVFYKSRGNVVIWFKHSFTCSLCPLVHSIGDFAIKTALVTPLGLLFEFIPGGKEGLDESLFNIVLSGKAEEIMDYMLTPKEIEVLYQAFFKGYYSQPRKITLSKLAEELGLSKSTLNEILRSAERKIITAYMRHDLPHLIVSKVLMRSKLLPA